MIPTTPEEIRALSRYRPSTPDRLDRWLRCVLDLRVPRVPICTDLGHSAPFDYLKAAFFEEFADAVVWANRGGGKTMLGAVVTLLDALFKPGVAVRILGGSLEQSQRMHRYLRRLLIPRFTDRLDRADRGRGQPGPLGARHVRFANGSEVEILAQSERSVRGNRVQKMRCDEIELFDTDVWTSCQLVTESREEARNGEGESWSGNASCPPNPAPWCGEGPSPKPGRSRRGSPPDQGPGLGSPGLGEERAGLGEERAGLGEERAGGGEIRDPKLIRGSVEAFSTMHRPHGLMHRVLEHAHRHGTAVFRWCVLDVLERCTGRDCRACPLEPDCRGRARGADGFFRIDDAIAARTRVSREVWESEMLCLRPSRRGTVFPAFSRQRHVTAVRHRPTWPTFRAIDFGFVHPFVCLWLQVGPRGDVHVLGEYVRSRATLASHTRRIGELDPGPVKMTFCDPAGGQTDQITGTTPRAELWAAGIPTRARPSAITDGLELIRRYLEGGAHGRPTIRIDPSCERLITAMEAYRYPDAGEARGGSVNPELPIKDGVHDHPIDALRYFFINHVGAGRGKLVERLY